MIKMNKQVEFYFFSLAVAGVGISGSDRIFIELARHWSRKHKITIFTSSEGKSLCEKQNLKAKKIKISSINNKPFERFFLINYIYKILAGVKLGLSLTINHQSLTILYPASDFWMDFFPALILKLRYRKAKLVATWYQTAPNPLRGYKEQETKNNRQRTKTYNFSAFLYWFSQLPVKPLIKKYADFVIVNNEDERNQFPEMNKKGKVVVLIGAVPLGEIRKYQLLTISHQPSAKRYDAVFQGRFHPQKGVVELIDIWRRVVEKKPDAKLAMIGDGPLREKVEEQIRNYELGKNVKLFGYVFDGPKKYKIFSQSKMVVHPSFYDSGGMASAEAMAFGLPAVGFNLKAYKSYYPKGMIKVKTGDLDAFATEILKLLENEGERKKLGKAARKMIEENWSWDERAGEVLTKILNSKY